MKTIKLLLASALLAGAASLAFAGPAPDHWARIKQAEKEHAEAKARAAAQAATPAKTPAGTQVAACTDCGCPGMKKS